MNEITPNLNKNSNIPLYIQLYNYIKNEIITGKIEPNEKLPSKRFLAKHLTLSLNTIQAAYDQLCAEGYIESKPRKGLFVIPLDNIFLDTKLPTHSYITEEPKKDYIDFHSGKIDLDNFPYREWRKLTLQSLYEDQGEFFYLGDSQGEISLRREISKYLFGARGVKCGANQILIGAGTQILIGLLSLLIGKEKIYAIENPGFYRSKIMLQDIGREIIPIELDKYGINVSHLKSSNADIVYVTPSHQFPYGMVMPIQRRVELLKWAETIDGYIIEDDYDGEYRYKGNAIPSLQSLDSKGHVIYMGTFSKSLIPSIRISYMVLPSKLLNTYKEHFHTYKQTVSRLHQNTLSKFMSEGYWQRHLNKMRTLYSKKHHALIKIINKQMGNQVKIIGEKSGLHIVLEVKKSLSEDELINKALEVGVKVYPLSLYYDGSKPQAYSKVLLGFGGLSEKDIETGIRLLKQAWGL